MVFHNSEVILKDTSGMAFRNLVLVLKDTSNMIFYMKPLVLSFSDARLASHVTKDNNYMIFHIAFEVLLDICHLIFHT